MKVAPPASFSVSATVPPRDSATARTIASPRPLPVPPPRSPTPRTKRSKMRARSSGGMPGPSSETSITTKSPSRRARTSTAVPGGVCTSAFWIRLSTSRCSSSPGASTTSGPPCCTSTVSPWPSATDAASPAASRTTAPAFTGSRRATRPASARASSSRSATSRRMRRDDRSADPAISASSPWSSAASSSRFARMLVSGVRSSCEASATKRRWRSSASSVSVRAWPSAREHLLERARQVGDLVVRYRLRQLHVRVARARDRLGRLGEPRDRRDRTPREREPGQQREHRSAEHADEQEQLDPRQRVLEVVDGLGVLEVGERVAELLPSGRETTL